MRCWAQIWIWFVDKEAQPTLTLSGILLSRNHWTKWRSKTHWTEITCTLAHSVERKSGQRKGEWNTGGKGNEFLPRVSITKAKRSKGGMSERRHQLLNGKSSKQLLFTVNDVWKRSLLGAFRFSVVKPNPMSSQQPTEQGEISHGTNEKTSKSS